MAFTWFIIGEILYWFRSLVYFSTCASRCEVFVSLFSPKSATTACTIDGIRNLCFDIRLVAIQKCQIVRKRCCLHAMVDHSHLLRYFAKLYKSSTHTHTHAKCAMRITSHSFFQCLHLILYLNRALFELTIMSTVAMHF